MYKFRDVTPRIKEMRERVRDRVIQIDSERTMLLTESYKQNEYVVPIIKRAMGTLHMCEGVTCPVEDFELIVGSAGKKFCGTGINSDWKGIGWAPREVDMGHWTLQDDGLYHTPKDAPVQLTMDPVDYENFKSVEDYWKTRRITQTCNAWQPDGYKEFAALEASSMGPGMPIMGVPVGHLVPGHKKIVDSGYGPIRKLAQDWLDAHEGDLMGPDLDKYLFYKSSVYACDAGIALCKRYAQSCKAKAENEQNQTRKAELLKMADGLEWISENGARNFWEACQATIMYQVLLIIDAGYPALAMGRFDQYTWPYLKKDLDEGKLTLDEAQEIVDAFLLKLNCFYKGGPGAVASLVGIGNTYQHTTIGGVDPITGEDATNPVTYMVLESLSRLQLHDPTVSVRINNNTPDLLWDCAIETAKTVGGLPLFQNDEVIIPGLQRELGFSLEDARDYGIIGCQEIVGCGNDYPAPNGVQGGTATVHYGVALTMALNNGINPMNGKQSKCKTGYLYEKESFEDVKQSVYDMCKFLNKWLVSMNNFQEYLTVYHAPHAALSISIEGCMENGKDCAAGGAKYNSFGGTATGLATLADSLTTIKYMVYDKKLCTAKELYDAYMANWEGYEELRTRILKEVPHYGNNDPYADEQMKWVCDMYYDICGQCYSNRAAKYKSGLYGASDHVVQGYHTFATPDGRHTGEPLADATSPAQSRDKNGPTSVFLSACCFDHSKFMDGLALNLRFSSSSFKSQSDSDKLRDLTKAYFKNNGMEVQYNIASTKELKEAQADPIKHKDLVVRIAGYSAYFVELNEDCQNDIISRSENTV